MIKIAVGGVVLAGLCYFAAFLFAVNPILAGFFVFFVVCPALFA